MSWTGKISGSTDPNLIIQTPCELIKKVGKSDPPIVILDMMEYSTNQLMQNAYLGSKVQAFGGLFANADGHGSNVVTYQKHISSVSGIANEIIISLHDDLYNPSTKFSIYSDNNGLPGTLLTSGTGSGTSWVPGEWFVTAPLEGIEIITGNTYWVGVISNGRPHVGVYAGSAVNIYKSETYSSYIFPETWSDTGYSWADDHWNDSNVVNILLSLTEVESEPTIITQGSYAFKCVAQQTTSLNKTLTRTISPTINLSDKNRIKIDMRSSRIGSNIKVSFHDVGGAYTEIIPNILLSDTWQTIVWDISGLIPNKDAIDKIIFTIINSDETNTFYIDNIYAES